jgi:membrane dipeptidase
MKGADTPPANDLSARRAPPRRLIWDMVFPLAPVVQNDFTVLNRYYEAGHTYVSLTIAGDDCGLGEAMHRLAQTRAEIAKYPDRFILALSVGNVLTAYSEGKLAIGLHLEGTECLERDPAAVELFYAAGIRHAILAFNRNNSAAGGCADLGNVGLSRLGQRYLDAMSSAGMLLDLSHMSERSTLEAMEYLGRPCVFTHSNAYALHSHYRNVTDEQAKACAATGGLIGISGSSAYIGPRWDLVDGVFAHIDYLVALVGVEHVGLGTDYVVDADALTRIFAERPDEWPTGTTGSYDKLAYLPPEAIEPLIERMAKAGYGNPAIDAILGGNYVRVARAVWR